jgi:hypothetical protein
MMYSNMLPGTKNAMSGKGTIEYTYDAAGNKLQKRVVEGNKETITDYITGFVYTSDTCYPKSPDFAMPGRRSPDRFHSTPITLKHAICR